ncbi:MAG TPA: vWA domain-containing protein [Amycolatopsis sp.]|uniref:vWA domain-containing protein n=1 Tax=Amycolatopsis sp. TaxID=37632 RepID=UPI002B4A32BA|nr:vWA domain-containing protein [Amycolatopsis sp.]HKS48317.1 vWA domain-containing protein [Amycolatopsis sp.]
MSSWLRKNFDGIGLTQSPPGPHLAALQAKYGGTVLLCIDVSGSMTGKPLREAIKGGEQFLTEAWGAYYRCGIVLWHDKVARYVAPDASREKVLSGLRSSVRSGGTNIVPALEQALKVFRPLTGDRVLCVFGDGDLGNRRRAVMLSRELCAMGVRIVVRGLGRGAAEALAELTCPGQHDDEQLITGEQHIGAGIASMAKGLTMRRKNGGWTG